MLATKLQLDSSVDRASEFFVAGGVYAGTAYSRLGPVSAEPESSHELRSPYVYLYGYRGRSSYFPYEAPSGEVGQAFVAYFDSKQRYDAGSAPSRSTEPPTLAVDSRLFRVARTLVRNKGSIALLLFLADQGSSSLEVMRNKLGLTEESQLHLLMYLLSDRLVFAQDGEVRLTRFGTGIARSLRTALGTAT